MDPLTHGLIGAALSTLSGHPIQLQDPVFLGCTLGSLLPDLDIVAHYKGRLNYLLKHRGESHSLIAFVAMSSVLSAILHIIYPSTPWLSIFLWTLAGTLSHGLTDVLNSYGAELLWPFMRKKFTVNMIMLTDPVVFVFFLISLLVSYNFPSLAQAATFSTIILVSLYLILREKGRLKVRNELMSLYQPELKSEVVVLPAMYRPFSWNFIVLQSDCVLYGTIKEKNPVILRILPQWDSGDPLVMAALEGNLGELFDQFTPYYHLVTQQSINNIWKVEFLDLRYWSKGNFLYSGQLNITENGEITQEKFYLSPDQDGVYLSY
jgi:inner membrane protein